MGKAPDTIKRLVDRFHQQADGIRSTDYNETLIRIDFINPLMKSLGWDIDNSAGYAEQYREVVHEDRVKVAGQTKAPDYSFRVGGVRKFFLEAKKPAVDIKNNSEPAYQLRRYAWSAKLAVSLLTDFEEFAIYDTRIQPKQLDKASTGRREFLRYTEYEQRWDFLYGTFSKDAVLRGEFDRYGESKKGRGATPFDDVFLGEIEEWRKALAMSLARRNDAIDEASLNFAVQRIIDRILFLRIAEDRGTETVGQLQSLLKGEGVYPRLVTLFDRADERYNSGLFHFTKEKDRDEAPDTLTPKLEVDDKTLKVIINGLYYPQSPYEFTMVSAEILGSVYERFLGNVITLTGGHNARIVEKPEVRKAGGVYYTPAYIVDYIVRNTVGKLLEGKTPKEAAKIRILDPACGSGSFLIGAYQFLLDWYLEQYTAGDPAALAQQKKAPIRPAIVKLTDVTPEERIIPGWALTIAERKRILLDHLHGVDLDSQAVEVTKLNLLLKCLEGETSETLGFQGRLFRERALPDLGKNIHCGNSLIGTDIYGTPAWEEMKPEERDRVNPFDYETAFPQVFRGKDRGFDAVIGNPPYIRIQSVADTSPTTVAVLIANYSSAAEGNYDIYVVFLERCLQVMRDAGRAGLIVPNKFLVNAYGRPIRQILKPYLTDIVHFGHQQVFDGATTYTCLTFYDRSISDRLNVTRVDDLSAWSKGKAQVMGAIRKDTLDDDGPWHLSVGGRGDLLQRLTADSPKLESVTPRIFQGIKTGADPVFIVERRSRNTFFSKALDAEVELENAFLYPLYKSGEMKRYALGESTRAIIFPYQSGKLVPWGVIESEAPKTAKYLQSCRHLLKEREKGRFEGDQWYMFSRSQALDSISLPKILTADLNPHPNFCLDKDGVACFPGGAAGGYGLLVAAADRGVVLGILNSRVTDFVIRSTSSTFRGGWLSYEAKYLRPIPLPKSLHTEEAKHVATLVDTILALHKRLAAEQLPRRREQIQREIDATDRQIDALVYQLYGLTTEEIAIVEEATR